MKKLLLVIFYLTTIISCNDKNEVLNYRISQLELENQILRDSLNQIEYRKILNSELIMIPQNSEIKLNESNSIIGMLVEHQSYQDYNIFMRDTTLYNTEPERELLFKNYSDYKFEFDYKPKSKNDNWVHILAEFDLDTVKIKIPGIIWLDIK